MSSYTIDKTTKRKSNYFILASTYNNLLGKNKDKDFPYKDTKSKKEDKNSLKQTFIYIVCLCI